MSKKIFMAALFFIMFFLFSCDSSLNKNSDSDSFDEISSCVEIAATNENGIGGICPLEKKSEQLKRSINDVTGSEKGNTMKIEEILYLEDRNEVIPKGECGQENKCAATFKNYDRSMFKDSLIGKEIVLYSIEGYYGDIYREEAGRDLRVLRHKDGTLIAVGGTGIVNEDGEHEWDIKVWPSELVPEVKVEQKILPSCESFCVEYMAGPDGEKESLHYDNLIAPPLEITVTGKKPVVVKNGEVVASEGYEYFVRDSIRATEEDSDGFVFVSGKKYKFDFFIVNTEALK
ncbi:MAG TPA: hypothetical protein P5044_06190 [bacterium]|nr:hypothetical protein [bacterium]